MSFLHTLPAVKKAAPIVTHEQRVQVLKEVRSDAMIEFLQTRAETSSVGWLTTLCDIGALDASALFVGSANADDLKERTSEWLKIAHATLDFVGEPKAKTSPDGIGTDAARKYTVFEASDEMRQAFHRATERLVLQVDALTQIGIKLPALDSYGSINHPMLGLLARWAGTACMLDRPDTLKLMVDAWPASMSCAIQLETKTCNVARINKDTNFYITGEDKYKRLTPFYCALQVGSTTCMDVILDKRASLGLSANAPISGTAKSRYNIGSSQPNLFSATLYTTDPVCTPKSFLHAIEKTMPALDQKGQQILALNMISNAEKRPNHFAAAIGKGYFHEDDQDPGCEEFRMRTLKAAVLHAQSALPILLKNVPWEALLEDGSKEHSTIYLATQKCRKDQRQPREDAILALIEQAKVDGRQDAVFATHAGRRQGGDQWLEPVTSLSAVGFNSVVLKFLENGFDPDSKHPDVASTLNQIADANNHPTRNMLRSFKVRDTAHRLIDEMKASAAPAP